MHEITQVVDVRAHPGSRRLPWFARAELARALPLSGVEYVHLPELGGRRRPAAQSPNTGWRNESFRGYADYMASAPFRGGVEELCALAGSQPTAMMCDVTVHDLTPFAVCDAGGLTYPAGRVRT